MPSTKETQTAIVGPLFKKKKKAVYTASANVTKGTENREERPALEAIARRPTTSRAAQSREERATETGLGVDMVLYGCPEASRTLSFSSLHLVRLRLAYDLREDKLLRLRTNNSHQKIARPKGHWGQLEDPP